MKKNILITGAGKGIGKQILLDCLNEFDFVYAVIRSAADLALLKKKLKNMNCRLYKGDISDHTLIKKIFKNSNDDNNMINCLVNNAGERQRKFFLDINEKDITNIFKNNFFNHFYLIQDFIKNIKKNSNNLFSVVNIGSIVGVNGFHSLAGYASTKKALDGLTKSLAVEFANKKVRFNIIHPGFIKTSYYKDFKDNKKELYDWTISRIPQNRWGDPKEVSALVCFLLSEKSSYITGQSICVDGGWTTS